MTQTALLDLDLDLVHCQTRHRKKTQFAILGFSFDLPKLACASTRHTDNALTESDYCCILLICGRWICLSFNSVCSPTLLENKVFRGDLNEVRKN